MSFLHPGLAIAAALAIAIPIIIHLLFRQRRRPIVWAAMRFLIEAYRKQRRRLQLEQLILLALRCLVVLLLGLAIARPLLDRAGLFGGAAGGRTIVLMLDNSLAGTRADQDAAPGAPRATALDRHKAAALQALAALGPADRAALITLARPARALVVPASSNFDAIARLIADIQPTDAPADLPAAIALIAGADEDRGPSSAQPITLAIFSDFLKGSADLAAALPALPNADAGTTILASAPARADATNIQIVRVAPLRAVSLASSDAAPDRAAAEPRRAIQARIDLRRTGDDLSAAQTVTARAVAIRPDGQPAGPVASAPVRFEPGAPDAGVAIRVPIDPDAEPAAARRATTDILRITIDADPIAGDNTALHLIPRREALRVALIAQRRFGALPAADRLAPADWLRLAAQPARQAPVDVIDLEPASVDRAALRGFDAALLPRPDLLSDAAWLALREFADAGGLVLVTPPAEPGVALWTDAMASAFSLGWRIAREPIAFQTPRPLSAEQPRTPILSFITAELDSLASAVRVFRALPLEATPDDATVVLTMSPGDAAAGPIPLLLIATPGTGRGDAPDAPRSRGLLAYLAIAPDLEWSDLPAKPLMVPLMQELLRQGVGAAASVGASLAGRAPELPPGAITTNAAPPARLPSGTAAATTAPGAAPPAADGPGIIVRAGLYAGLDPSGRPVGPVAVNADPTGGDVGANTPDAVRLWLTAILPPAPDARDRVAFFEPGNAGAFAQTSAASAGGALALLLLALAAAIAETILARFFSHAQRDTIAARLATPAAGTPPAPAAARKAATA